MRKFALSIAAGCVLMILPSAAQAESASFRACMAAIDMHAFTNSQRLDCATRDMDRADGALNRTYRRIKVSLPPARQRALVLWERRWIDHRRATCALENMGEPPLAEFNRMTCLVDETDAQTRRLKAMW
ncbi:MAG: lysozyme inhibitor LprI family protein [Sphingomonas sp.]